VFAFVRPRPAGEVPAGSDREQVSARA